MLTRHLATWAVALGVFAIVTTANAGIVIRNGSFEDNWLPDFSWQHLPPNEWTIGGDDPDDAGYQNNPAHWITPEAIDGDMSAFIDGIDGTDPAWLALDLQYDCGSSVLAADGLLVDLAFYVGKKGYAPKPIIEVILQCESGGSWQTFASFTYDGAAEGLPDNSWDYVHAPLVMTGVTGSGYEGQPVALTFLNHATHGIDYYAQGSIDAVAIIPEPMTLSLLALGGLAMLRRRRG